MSQQLGRVKEQQEEEQATASGKEVLTHCSPWTLQAGSCSQLCFARVRCSFVLYPSGAGLCCSGHR